MSFNATSVNFTDFDDNDTFHLGNVNHDYETVRSVLTVIGIMLGIASVILNAFFLLVMRYNREMSTSPYHRFMQNLALADMLASLTFLLVQNYSLAGEEGNTMADFAWNQGLPIVLRSTPWMFFCAYILTLTCLTANQYIAVCKPTEYSTIMTKKKIYVSLACIWFVSSFQILVPAVCLLVSTLTSDSVDMAMRILGKSSNVEIQTWMSIFAASTLLNIILDVAVYMRIKQIKARSKRSNTHQHEEAFFTVTLLLLASIVCRLPFQLVGIIELNMSLKKEESLLVHNITALLLYLNFFGDPIVYILRIKHVKDSLEKLTLTCRKKVFKSWDVAIPNPREELSVTRDTEIHLQNMEEEMA